MRHNISMKKQNRSPKHRDTQTINLQNTRKNRKSSIQMRNEKLKFIENEKNTYKPIQILGLYRISKSYHGMKKVTKW